MKDNLELWLRLSTIEGMSVRKKCELVTQMGDITRGCTDHEETLLVNQLTAEQYEAFHSESMRNEALRIIERCNKKHIRILPLSHEEYPEMLKYIHDPPLILYVKGRLPQMSGIALVGSRKASGYGIETAVKLSTELAASGIMVVSGMARGIDTAAHCGALNAGGETAAVLGCGVDIAYPPENSKLMERIAESGAVLSEYPPGTPPATFHFPCRNRIISGMTLGTVVVEASLKSGSLITAHSALEQGREVFAVPGNITHFNSMGTNRLIKDGAKMVLTVDDILDELHFGLSPINRNFRKKKGKEEAIPSEGKKIMNALKLEDLYDEELSQKTGISAKELYGILLDLELKGLIQKSINGKYRVMTKGG